MLCSNACVRRVSECVACDAGGTGELPGPGVCVNPSLKSKHSNAHAQPNVKKTLSSNISLCGSDNDIKCNTTAILCPLSTS